MDELLIENIDLFIETLNLYRRETDKAIELINNLGLTKSLDIYLLLSFIMESDIYKKDVKKTVTNDIFSILGSEVLNGNPLCRHKAFFMYDIISQFNSNVTIIPVTSNEKDEPLGTHVILGIYDDTKAMFVDPSLKNYQYKNNSFTDVLETHEYYLINNKNYNDFVFGAAYNHELINNLVKCNPLEDEEFFEGIRKIKPIFEKEQNFIRNALLDDEASDLINLNITKILKKGEKI